jgi:hypothetical protein
MLPLYFQVVVVSLALIAVLGVGKFTKTNQERFGVLEVAGSLDESICVVILQLRTCRSKLKRKLRRRQVNGPRLEDAESKQSGLTALRVSAGSRQPKAHAPQPKR